jgi:uncharacterized protein (DUF4415 family)
MKTTSNSDWERVKKLSNEEIDTSDAPEWDASMFANAKVQLPERKKTIAIRIDNDLIDWYKAQGKGYQTRMVAVLRMYKDAKTKEENKSKPHKQTA